MTAEQQDSDVTIFVRGVNEFYGLGSNDLKFADATQVDALDPNHPYLEI